MAVTGNTIKPTDLVIKKSLIPGAGKGLFARKAIEKGALIVEYKGRITTWKKVQESGTFNAYVFYVTRNHVVDAMKDKKVLGRYANDARGMVKIPGIRNNSEYIIRQKRVFIRAKTAIAAGGEIMVAYGKEYWDVIRHNKKLDAKKTKVKPKTRVK